MIDLYLRLNKDRYDERAQTERTRHLQLFAERHGWRFVNETDCSPIHIEEWIKAHPEWKSEWTKAKMIATVQRPFNWAAKRRVITSNPFRGLESRPGQRRRPMTDAEFQKLLRACSNRHRKPTRGRYASGRKICRSDRKKRSRPSIGARFRQVLTFLKLTGARPGELCNLACISPANVRISLKQCSR